MVIHNIVMDDDDDLEALRLAALQTIRPRITSKRHGAGMGHYRQNEKGPFIRPVNNPNLIAIVPTELPPVEAKKPISKPEKNNKVVIDVIEDIVLKEDEKKTSNKVQEAAIEEVPQVDNSDDSKRESRLDSATLYDLEEDVLDFETESIAGSEEDLLQLHDSDSDSLEKLMESIEKELSTTTTSQSHPKSLSRLKSKPAPEVSKPTETTNASKQTNNVTVVKQKSPPASAIPSNKQKEPSKSNQSVKQKSPPKVDSSKLENLKASAYEKFSPTRRRYSPPKQSLKQTSPVDRIHSPRRSPLPRKRSLSPRKRSITPHKRSLTPRKRSLTPRKRTASPRRRSPSPRKRSLTPRKRSPSLRKRSLSPRKRSPTPRKRSISRKRSLTPRKRSITPRRRSLTPRKRSLSPRKRSMTPRRRSITPRKRSLTPRKRSLTPRKRTMSPRRRSLTPRRLSPRRRSISPRRRRSISPRRRSISPRRRSQSRRRSLSPWRRSPSPRRSPPRRRSPTPKKRSLSPRRRSLTPKKRSLTPRKRSVSPRRRSVSPNHNSPGKRRRPPSPVNLKRSERGKRSPIGRRQWNRNKPANVNTSQNNNNKGGGTNGRTGGSSSGNGSSGGNTVGNGGGYRSNSSRNVKDDEKRTRSDPKEARPREKVNEAIEKSELIEKNGDTQHQKTVDPKLEARKRKFENNYLVGTVNKKIRLKSEQNNSGSQEDMPYSEVEQHHKEKENSPVPKSNRKRIILEEDKKRMNEEENKEPKPRETLTTRNLGSNLKRSADVKKTVDEEAPVKKKRNEDSTKEDSNKKGVDLRTELSRRRAERMKGANPTAKILQSAIEGAVGKIKQKSRASPPSDQEAPPSSDKKSSKPKGRRVHVLPAKSSKAEDKKSAAEDKNSGLSLHYRSSSPNRMSGRSILRRNQV